MTLNQSGKPPNLDEIWEDVKYGIECTYKQEIMSKKRFIELYT